MRPVVRSLAWLALALLLLADQPASAERAARPAGAKAHVSVENYVRARRAYEAEADAYWTLITEKRRTRMTKRRNSETIVLADYVLTQPPIYTGPARPPGAVVPRDPKRPRLPPIPTVKGFLSAAAEHHGFVPLRPESDLVFKLAYARVATAAGITRDQAVRIYAFETGGNGTYDVQAGLTHPRPNSKPISPAMGYNQLLSTNSMGLLAEHGDRFVAVLQRKADSVNGDARRSLDVRIEAARRMVAFSRSVPYSWHEHDKIAKTTRPGQGLHAAVLDIDLGPLLQTQKLLDSVVYARKWGYTGTLTGAELELMNFTGDGSGFDMVTMPQAFREQVPTSNFFQRGGYERNPIARRTETVARLIASIDAKMDRAAQLPGARELADAFDQVERRLGQGTPASSVR